MSVVLPNRTSVRGGVPVAVLGLGVAVVVVGFIEWRWIALAIDREKNAGAAFDVFWLWLLSLAE